MKTVSPLRAADWMDDAACARDLNFLELDVTDQIGICRTKCPRMTRIQCEIYANEVGLIGVVAGGRFRERARYRIPKADRATLQTNDRKAS